jgi:DNA-binding MarR family transcriptional regulator
MSGLDMFIALALTNLRYKVDLLGEQQKALQTIDREKCQDDEEYLRVLSDAEDAWWDIPQPLLDKRTPKDAIRETLRKYGLE